MAFRVEVEGSRDAFDVAPGESVLAAALRGNVKLPHSCTVGGCGTCRVKVREGRVRYDGFPMALSREEAAQGYALACQALPETDLVIAVPRIELAQPTRQPALVAGVSPLSDHVVHLELLLPELASLDYRPGQHMNVLLPDGTHRSFSMASPPDGNAVDFHIRRISGGRFTESLLGELQAGDMLEVEIPLGAFRYHDEDYREILMVATGTGISPLRSMMHALMDDPDCPPVSLYWGGRTPADLYLHDEIPAWGARLYEFRYRPVLSRPGTSWGGERGHVQDAVARDFQDLSEHSIYLCGSPAMIHDAKEAFLARGASVDHIYAEGFNFQK